MRSIVIATCLFSISVAGALAQQAPSPPAGSPPSSAAAVGTPPKPKPTTLKPSQFACAGICSKAVSELTLSDEDKLWFDQCAGALLCPGRRAPPLVYQPGGSDVIEDGGIGGFLLKK